MLLKWDFVRIKLNNNKFFHRETEDENMTINALICDDDSKCGNLILKYLLKYCEDRNITCFYDLFNDGQKTLESEKSYNIAFLDIEIGDISGINIAKKLKENNKNIIIFFITEYEKYIDDAMDLFALRFIKKPLDYQRFITGLDKAIELINDETIELFLKDENVLHKVKAKDIIYLETNDHKVKIVTTMGIFYSSDLIDIWEKKLTHISFYRIHKSYILNLDYIDQYKRNEVKLTTGEIIGISYRKQSMFRKYFFDYLKRRK